MTHSPRFSPRACPLCAGQNQRGLAQFDALTLVRSNWSYRQDAIERLGLSPHERFPIVACEACGFVHAALLPDASFLATLYDEVIDADLARRHNLSAANTAAKMDYLGTLLRLLPGDREARVLDYGCGFGPTLQALCAVPGVRALGFESSPARIADLRARGLTATSDPAQLQSAAPFDAIVLDNVLEHLPDPRGTFAFLRTLMAPAATLFVSVPALGERDILAAARAQRDARTALRMDINPWEHLSYFDLAHLDRLLAGIGMHALAACALPSAVDVGLRPQRQALRRAKNALGTLKRVAGYAVRGEAMASVTARFYAAGAASQGM